MSAVEKELVKTHLIETGIHYRSMQASDLESASLCFAVSFQREPMVQCLGISVEEFLPFARICCQLAIEQGLGLVAFDEQEGKIAGFTILQDALLEIPEDTFTGHGNLIPIFEILDRLQSNYIREKNISASGTVVVSFVTGVNLEYQGSKIAFHLFGQSMELAKALGFETMITLVTGRFSQNGVRRRYSFAPHSSIYYNDFQFKGETVFANLPDTKLSCMLMERNIKS